ncbi:cytochrome P450 [Mycobacterium sp. CVI_P3]|uniref:Cytochrome P450 n=1 Tax=Mycobacterium pinniadriaticum TaxID=2994102 RepID=A0ABT3SBE2_9MYCO|nr:cytochrome P450 [Mycobacterium pinniadriaticum]MCX2930407.1 cytochrome P450 [Mycobacterium pinniadriaticum]MCX2936831.1 cytochrome P450 [Mycobacterium pinniadriaticum]
MRKFQFVSGGAGAGLDARSPQPANYLLAQQGSVALGSSVMVGRRSLVGAALSDAGTFSSCDLVEQGQTKPLIPLGIDPPDHTRYRRLLEPMFSPRRMEAQEADIADRVNRFIDTFIDRGSCDFTSEFAELFPSSVFLGLMGLPWEELGTLVAMRDGLLHPGSDESTFDEKLAIQRGTAQNVYAFFDSVLDQRMTSPQQGLITELAHAQIDGEPVSRDDLLSICFVLLTAGLDTVTDTLTCFWAYLAQHADQRRHLSVDPEVIPRAVEELLRWETPVPWAVRWAREQRAVGEHVITAGHHLLVNLGAANVDPEEFPDPLTVDFDRRGNRHLAFGAGPHRCLGSHLARRELRIALREWHRRIPEYSLSPGYEVRYRPPLRFVPDLQLSWPGPS